MAPRRTVVINGIAIKVYTKSVMVNKKILFIDNDPDKVQNFMSNLMEIIAQTYSTGYTDAIQYNRFNSDEIYQKGRESRDKEILSSYNRGKSDHADFVKRMLEDITKEYRRQNACHN